jgi:hypothetical protein
MKLPLSRLWSVLSILYGALGPPLLYVLYLFIGDHLPRLVSPRGDMVLIVLVASGAACAYIGVSGSRWFRIGMALVSVSCSLGVTLFAAFAYECGQGNCL